MIDARSHHPIQNRWRAAMPVSAPGPLPTVVEQSGRGDRAFDIYSRLLRERIISVSYTHLTLPTTSKV